MPLKFTNVNVYAQKDKGTFKVDFKDSLAQWVPLSAHSSRDNPVNSPEINPALRQSPAPDTLTTFSSAPSVGEGKSFMLNPTGLSPLRDTTYEKILF